MSNNETKNELTKKTKIHNQLTHNKNLINYENINKYDYKSNFQNLKILYGREKEIKTINTIFNQVKEGNRETILISGYSGIGKSSLIDKLYYDSFKDNSYFIYGKFDQFDKNIPYKAIIQAFQGLIDKLMNESSENLKKWKKNILRALGPNGQVIINVIPSLELIIGPQPELSELGPLENQNRFQLYFQKFFQIFTNKNLPLVMFLDDLQWADIASLNLMKILFSNIQFEKFLFIGAYRDNEIYDCHPLKLTLNEINMNNKNIHEISLGPLSISDVCHIISNNLNYDYNKITNLGELIYKKTGGNPFFINEFLRSLYQDKILIHNKDISSKNDKNKQKNIWQWDIKKISDKKITDNAADLFKGRINNFQINTQELIKLAACIGSRFDLETISIIYEKSENETFNDFASLINEGLLFYVSEKYNFVHDKMQEAVYSLIDEQEKEKIHYKIGSRLLKESKKEDLEKNIFYITDQLNYGREIITDNKKRLKLIELNLTAGKKAKKSTAYESALKYFDNGIKLLNINCWENQYNLTLSLYVEKLEIEYLITNYENMEKTAIFILSKTENLIDKIQVYQIKIQALIAQNKLIEAINYSRIILRELEIKLPKKINIFYIIIEYIKTQLFFNNKEMKELESIPAMTDQIKLSGLKIMISTALAAFYAAPNLVPILVFKALKLSYKYGNTIYSSYCYCAYGLILCGFFNKISSGYKFGIFALKLLKKTNSKELYAKVYLLYYTIINHWKNHLKNSLPPLIEGFKSGLETGDLEYAALCADHYCAQLSFTSKRLSFVNKEMAKYSDIVKTLNQEKHFVSVWIDRQFILNLMGHSSETIILRGKVFDETVMVPKLIEANDQTNLGDLYIFKSILCFLFYEHEKSLIYLKKAETCLIANMGLYIVSLYNFYLSLTITSLYPAAKLLNKIKFKNIIKKNQKKMKEWANHAPMNYLHKYLLVEAEFARITGDISKAEKLYEKSIKLASKNEYINEEALANELTAKFYLLINKEKKAKKYISISHDLYLQWEADAKAKHIEENYSDLLL